MNREHLKAMVWLRWRSLVNSLRRSGKVNSGFAGVLVFIASAVAVGIFCLVYALGVEVFPKLNSGHLMIVWDVLVGGYAISWLIGMNPAIQGSAPVSIDKLLHLPVSTAGAFLSNFSGSFASLSNLLFVPLLFGAGCALVVAKGSAYAIVVPLILALVFMATTVAYQVNQWLALLISSKRGRSIVFAVFMITFSLLSLTPSVYYIQKKKVTNELNKERWAQIGELESQHEEGALTEEEFTEQRDVVTKTYEDNRTAVRQARGDAWIRGIRTANTFVPIGWLPHGITQTTEGRQWPAWAGIAGMLLIGVLSLRRSFQLTMRCATGQRTGSGAHGAAVSQDSQQAGVRGRRFEQWSLPLVSERCSTVVMTTVRFLMRAPEVKMAITSPLVMVASLGMVIYLLQDKIPDLSELFTALIVLGVMSFGGGFATLILVENQFNFESNGFRCHLLMPGARHEILLGKNLAIVPIGLVIGIGILGIAQLFVALDFSVVVANCLQMVTVCAIFCLIGNMVSILSPLNASQSKLAQARNEMVNQFLIPMLVVPFAFLPVYIPVGITLFFQALEWGGVFPVYLVSSALTLGLMLVVYWWVLLKQGALLQKREIRILNTLDPKNG